VRELENCIERAVLLCNEGVIRSEHLPPSLQMADSDIKPQQGSFQEIVESKEKELLMDALKKSRGHQKNAAVMLGLTERIFNYKLRQYNILPKIYKLL
jgi:Nif-specific regulatory protein